MKNFRYQIGLYFSSLLLLSACGFQPIYGNITTKSGEQTIEQSLRAIDIATIPNFEGQFLRNELIDRLHNTGEAHNSLYTLVVEPIQETKKDLDITKESDATIAQLRVATSMQLIRKSDNKPLIKKRLWSTASYNILDSQFTTRVSRNYARENGLKDLAAQIERQVSLAIQTQK